MRRSWSTRQRLGLRAHSGGYRVRSSPTAPVSQALVDWGSSLSSQDEAAELRMLGGGCVAPGGLYGVRTRGARSSGQLSRLSMLFDGWVVSRIVVVFVRQASDAPGVPLVDGVGLRGKSLFTDPARAGIPKPHPLLCGRLRVVHDGPLAVDRGPDGALPKDGSLPIGQTAVGPSVGQVPRPRSADQVGA